MTKKTKKILMVGGIAAAVLWMWSKKRSTMAVMPGGTPLPSLGYRNAGAAAAGEGVKAASDIARELIRSIGSSEEGQAPRNLSGLMHGIGAYGDLGGTFYGNGAY